MKTIFVPTSHTHPSTHVLAFAEYVSIKTHASVKEFPIESPQYSSYENYADSRQFNRIQQTTHTYDQVGLAEGALPVEDLIIIDEAFITGRYEIAANSEAEGTKGIYASDEYIMDNHAEGTKGTCAAHELPLHPVVEELMNVAHCPILTVVTNKTELLPLKTVVLVTDGEQNAAPLFQVLSQLQRSFRFNLHLLHINRCFHQQNSIEVVNNMRELAKLYSLTNYKMEVIEDYTYEEGIIHYSKKVKADMIALPVDGHKIISGLLEEVVNPVDPSNHISYLLSYKIS